MSAAPTRRVLVLAWPPTALNGAAIAAPELRGDDTERLPDHAGFWARMLLPFTPPAQAWHRLSPATQAEIGAAVIGMALAEYIAGDGMADADQFHDEALRSDAVRVNDDLLNRLTPRLWALLPDSTAPTATIPLGRSTPAWPRPSDRLSRNPSPARDLWSLDDRCPLPSRAHAYAHAAAGMGRRALLSALPALLAWR